MIVLLCMLVFGALSLVYNYIYKHVEYEATAQLLVEQSDNIILMTDAGGRMPPTLSVETQLKLIKSMSVAEEAAKILGSKDPKKDADDFSRRVYAASEEDTGILRISARGENAEECADIANSFAHAFETVSRGIQEKSTKEMLAYISEQLENAKNILNEKEMSIFEFNQANGVVMLTEEMTNRNKMIIDLETEMYSSEIDARQIEAHLDNLRFAYDDETYKIMQDIEVLVDEGVVAEIRFNMNELEVERAGLLVKYKPSHPIIKKLDGRIAEYQQQLESYISGVVNNRLISPNEYSETRRQIADLETQLILARAKMSNTRMLKEKLKQDQMQYPKLQYEYTRLLREKDVAEKLFLLMYEQLQQAQIEEVRRDVKVSVFEEARVPKGPVSPNRMRNIMVAVTLGFFVGVGLAFLLEEMEETIRTSDDVKNNLNLPVLGSVPYSAETINKLITDVPLKSPIAEAYRRLSFFTQLFCLDPPIKTLLITSSKSDEGKSTTLANLAISMAQEGTKVLIVDTDLRRPMLHRMFGVDNSLGLSSILTGELEAEIAVSDLSVSGHLPKESFMEVILDRLIQPSSIKGLNIIPSGPLPANSIELLRSERMLAFLRCVEKKADIVIFDSPPAIHVIDAVVLSQILDGVLFVINSGRINRDEALQVKYMIESTKTPIIGVALNNIEASSPDYYYYYYYGGYGYGSRQRRKRVKLKR